MREDFHAQIDALVDTLLSMGERTIDMLERATTSLVTTDAELADDVISDDNGVDATYAAVQSRVVKVMALQAPVASDLRLLSSMFHVNIHLERMGDYAVNVAKMGKLSAPYPHDPELSDQLEEMGRIATTVARHAITAYAQMDLQEARRLPDLDDGVDRLNIGMFKRLVRLGSRDEDHLEWATRMILVARQIERYGDHAVDIGEATIFAATGEMVELSSNAPDARAGRRVPS